MKTAIIETLKKIEQEHNVRILYAAEAGSRAWGFASPDSDYDVRYIYVHRMEDYLRIDSIPDTIQGPLDDIMDFSGWDLKKTLGLLYKTNPSLMEWAQSPVVYYTTPAWECLKKYFPKYFHAKPNMHHYLSMTADNWEKHMRGDQVKLKKYLYVLRPLLCCRWLEQFGTMPPVSFDRLCEQALPSELKPVVQDLLRRKQNANEAETITHIPELTAFCVDEISRLNKFVATMPDSKPSGYAELNALFLQLLERVWHDSESY